MSAGAAAGLVAWLLIEKTGWFTRLLFSTSGIEVGTDLYRLQTALGALYGMVVAVGVFLASWGEPRPRAEKIRLLVLSGIAGLVGGAIGMEIGFWAYNAIVPPGSDVVAGPTNAQMLDGVLARSVGWALIGVAIGAAQGFPRKSLRTAGLGAIGGFMGGIAGGSVFEAMEIATSNPAIARFTGFIFLGAAIGFFLEFVPYMMKQAWIKIEKGRGEGSEFVLDKRWTSVGRSETADVSLFGDSKIAPIHFLIEAGPPISLLRPAHKAAQDDSIATILVDGVAINGDTPLQGGESIEVGRYKLKFFVKATSATAAKPTAATKPSRRPVVNTTSEVPKVPRAAYTSVKTTPLRPEEVGYVAASRRIADDGLTGTKLLCIHGPYFGQSFVLATRDRIVIGRSSECDIPLTNDRAISRQHCSLRLHSGRHWLEDLKSTYGTFIDDQRVNPKQPQMLRPGDKIKLGDTLLEYE